MEFPDLGRNCAVKECNILDILPIKCDGCHETFCKNHYTYVGHSCKFANANDRQVPECPLCNMPIPLSADESPDLVVSNHIDTDCKSDPAKARRLKKRNLQIYKNPCSFFKCKNKEIISIKCNKCLKNFCLKHRHELDHNCEGKPADQQNPWKNFGRNLISTFQGNLTEEEAMKQAMEESIRNNVSENNVSENNASENNVTENNDSEVNEYARQMQQVMNERRNRFLTSNQVNSSNKNQNCILQ